MECHSAAKVQPWFIVVSKGGCPHVLQAQSIRFRVIELHDGKVVGDVVTCYAYIYYPSCSPTHAQFISEVLYPAQQIDISSDAFPLHPAIISYTQSHQLPSTCIHLVSRLKFPR